MNESERRDRIVEYLRIKPINHGQVYTFQIAIPGSEVGHINEPRREELRRSLTEQGSNLIPLIVRRTKAYSELEEYEVVYGVDWCIVAKELDIEKLWVWVFDMTDEQAAAAKIQMEQLVGATGNGEKPSVTVNQTESLIDKKLQIITDQLNRLVALGSGDGKLLEIEQKIECLTSIVNSLESKVEQLLPPPKLNLLQATEQEIDRALQEKGVKLENKKAALVAIKSWKNSDEGLTWQNIEKSTKTGKNKIKNFAKATYEKLKEIGDIPS